MAEVKPDSKIPASPRVRSYREFLTPLLHRRFVSAFAFASAICYVEALFLCFQSSQFLWLPFASLLPAFVLAVSTLIVFLLRIAQIRFGARNDASPLYGALAAITDFRFLQIVFAYFLSAWVFSEVHIYAAPYEADLGWVANGQLYERLRLNERVVFLRSHAFIAASVQTIFHLHGDYSFIALPVTAGRSSETESQKGASTLSVKSRVIALTPKKMGSLFKRSLIVMMASPFVYMFVRSWAWAWSLWFARLVWNIPEGSQPAIIPPFHWSLLFRTTVQGMLLFGLWEYCNILFTCYVAQEPIKRGKPLSADSKDPNGSLISGLQAKKMAVRSFALWELDLIVQRFGDRRKSILTEIDRRGDSAWEQVLTVCLQTINALSSRVEGPPPAPTSSKESLNEPLKALPKIATPMKTDSVAEAAKARDGFGKVVSLVDSQARRVGEAAPGTQFDLSPRIQKYVGEARDRLLTPEQKAALSKQQLENSAHGYLGALLRFKVPMFLFTPEFQPGRMFQETFIRRVKSVLFGSPFSERTTIMRAVDIICSLLVISITEDTYGVVSKNVPEIWRALIKAIDAIEKTLKVTTVHWTDVEYKDGERRDDEIDEVLQHLRDGLSSLIRNFSREASARGLTPADIREARRAAKYEERG